jgi:hypothetical protein
VSCTSGLTSDWYFATDELWTKAIRLHDIFEKQGDRNCLEECIIAYGRLLQDDGIAVRAFLLDHHDELT